MDGKGCVHLYTGEGKGKTTAAVGLAVRALGQGLRVGFCQFMKSGRSGELAPLEQLGAAVLSPRLGEKFLWQMDAAERAACAERQAALLAEAGRLAQAVDLLVLDEAVCAAGAGLLAEGALADFVGQRPEGLELVLTGRGADEALLALADYATEMRPLAHPYDRGRPARRGIEY